MLEHLLDVSISLSTLSVCAITLAVVYAVKSWLSHPPDLPPMPRLPVPFFGHTLFMTPSAVGAFRRWRQNKQVGDIFTVYVAGRPNIVINTYELLVEAFVRQADFFSDRPVTVRSKILGSEKGVGIVSNSKEPWKQQRTVSMSILRAFGMGKNLMAEKIGEEVEALINEMGGFKGEARNVHLLLNNAVSNVICAILLGDRFDYNNPILNRVLDQNKVIFTTVPASSILHPFPFLRFLPGDLFGAKKLSRVSDELLSLFSDHFVKRFIDNDVNDEDLSTENFIKAYLKEMRKRQHSDQTSYLDETNLVRNISHLFVAGTETTSSTILWALVFAMRHPDIQEKVYKEIEEVVGRQRPPQISDKLRLNYTHAFIMESQRLGSIAPLGLSHVCSRTTQVGGFTIPEGAIIMPNLDAVMKDPNTWDKPLDFRPERFLDDEGKIISPGQFVPFSLGRRACMGEALARMELFLFVSAIFHKFKVTPEDATKDPFAITNIRSAFKVRFVERT